MGCWKVGNICVFLKKIMLDRIWFLPGRLQFPGYIREEVVWHLSASTATQASSSLGFSNWYGIDLTLTSFAPPSPALWICLFNLGRKCCSLWWWITKLGWSISDSASFDKELAAPSKTVSKTPFYFSFPKLLLLGLQWLCARCAIVMQASISRKKKKGHFSF